MDSEVNLISKFKDQGFYLFIDLFKLDNLSEYGDRLYILLIHRDFKKQKAILKDNEYLIYIFFNLYKNFPRNSKISMRLLYEIYDLLYKYSYILKEIKEYLSGLDHYNEIEYLLLCCNNYENNCENLTIKDPDQYREIPSILEKSDYENIIFNSVYNLKKIYIFLAKFSKLDLQSKYNLFLKLNIDKTDIDTGLDIYYENYSQGDLESKKVLIINPKNKVNKLFFNYFIVNIELLIYILEYWYSEDYKDLFFENMNQYIMGPESRKEKLSSLLKLRYMSIIRYKENNFYIKDIDAVIGILLFNRLVNDPRRSQSIEDILLSLE